MSDGINSITDEDLMENKVTNRRKGKEDRRSDTQSLLSKGNGVDEKGDELETAALCGPIDHVDDDNYVDDYDDDDDYYEEDEHYKENSNSANQQYSFEFRNGNSVYEVSVPTCGSIWNRFKDWLGLDWNQINRIPWIVLTLFVMTETIRRFDSHTGILTGHSSLRQPGPHGHYSNIPVTTYGEEQTTIDGTYHSLSNNVGVPPDQQGFPENTGSQVSYQSEQLPLQPPQSTESTGANSVIDQPVEQSMPLPSEQQQKPQSQSQHQQEKDLNGIPPSQPSTPIEFGTPITTLPQDLEASLADVSLVPSPTDVPVFWHIPRSAGTTMKTLFGTCMGKVMSSEIGIMDGHGEDAEIKVVERSRPYGRFVNVNTETLDGIERAKSLGLVGSGLAEIISTSHFQEVAGLFNAPQEHRGRMFCIMRHPVDRVASMFHYLSANGAWAGRENVPTTIDEYAHNPHFVESNWMVRFLTGRKAGTLDDGHLDSAKEILRKKFLVGLYDDLDETVQRILRYSNWRLNGDDQRSCADRVLHDEANRIGRNPHDDLTYENNPDVYHKLSEVNNLDIKLYEYARQLYKEQKILSPEQ